MGLDEVGDADSLFSSLVAVAVVHAEPGNEGHPALVRLIDEDAERLCARFQEGEESPVLMAAVILVEIGLPVDRPPL